MTPDRVNADFTKRIVIATDRLPWVASPQPGVERRMLDRVGGEVARATSLVRYAASSGFSAHGHALGEEFLVLEGVFSDEYGDYPAGTYVRNPPGSLHTPRSGAGCTIFVKLRQMPLSETQRVVKSIAAAGLDGRDGAGWRQWPLYASSETGETVAIEKLDAGSSPSPPEPANGEEIFILAGDLTDEEGDYGPGTWIRNPAGHRNTLRTRGGATYWVKRGHLRPDV